VPLGFARPRLDDARVVLVAARERLLAARTAPIGGGLLVDSGGLLRDGQVEHLLGEHFTDFEENSFDLAESASPSGALGAVEALSTRFLATPST
jgi:hypothetical protein